VAPHDPLGAIIVTKFVGPMDPLTYRGTGGAVGIASDVENQTVNTAIDSTIAAASSGDPNVLEALNVVVAAQLPDAFTLRPSAS